MQLIMESTEISSDSLNDDIARSDVVITDVSSIFFDALYAGRRVCCLVPDEDWYNEHDRGTYLPLSQYYNGWIYTSMKSLLFDSYKIASFGENDFRRFVSKRDAKACKRITLQIKRMHGMNFPVGEAC